MVIAYWYLKIIHNIIFIQKCNHLRNQNPASLYLSKKQQAISNSKWYKSKRSNPNKASHNFQLPNSWVLKQSIPLPKRKEIPLHTSTLQELFLVKYSMVVLKCVLNGMKMSPSPVLIPPIRTALQPSPCHVFRRTHRRKTPLRLHRLQCLQRYGRRLGTHHLIKEST